MGSVRSWIIRALILSVLAGLAWGGWIMHDWVSPERVRAAVLASLREQFPECQVEISGASLRLFGGICVSDWTLTRTGESEPFFRAESASIAHDKEQLNNGRVVIRKIELEGPVLRVQRLADGTLNLSKILKEGPSDQPIPTVTIRNATIHLTDARPDGLPPLTITASKLNLLNDPIQQLKIEIQAVLAPSTAQPNNGLSVAFNAIIKHQRQTQATTIKFEVPNIQLTPDLAPALGKISPQLAEHLSQLTARIGIKADLVIQPAQPIKYDVKLEVKDGRLDDPELPFPVEHLSAIVQIKDGKVIVEKGTAKLGRANAEFSLETADPAILAAKPNNAAVVPASLMVPPPPMGAEAVSDPMSEIEAKLDRLELTLHDLTLDDEFFNRLPGPARKVASQVRTMFSPVGSIDVTCKFNRTGSSWKREIKVVPNRLAITYEHFRYPILDIAGWVNKVMASDGTDEYRMQVTGSVSGRRVELTGRIQGSGPDPQIDLKIAGTDIPIDDKFFNALPENHRKILNQLNATARGDFIVECKQPFGTNRCENTFRVRVYDGNMNYANFPYALSRVKGHVLIRVAASDPLRPVKPGLAVSDFEDTDRVELREFEACHDNAKLWLSGDFEPIPGTRLHRFVLKIQGDGMPLDDDLRNALRVMKAGDIWGKLQPRGLLTFGADLEMLDRTPPPVRGPKPENPEVLPVVAALPGDQDFNPVTDLKLAINFRGPTVTPQFFQYELQDLAGVLRYADGKIDLGRFSAKHGESRIQLDAAKIVFGDGGELWANMGGLNVKPLVVDPVLIEALPPKLRGAVTDMKLRGKMELALNQLVIKVPPLAEKPAARGQAPQVLPILPPPIGKPLPVPPEPQMPDPIIYWNSDLKLQGASFSAGLDYSEVHGIVSSVGRSEGNLLGSVMGKIYFDKLIVNKIPLTTMKADFQIRPQVADPQNPAVVTPPILEFPMMSALLFHGTIGGEARIELSDTPRYRAMLTGANVRLEEIATHLKMSQQTELRGLAQGKLYVENAIDPKSGQSISLGAGQIDIPNGRMLNLPVLLPLLKLLKMQAPDQTAFEEAHAVFELKGDRVTVSQLDLIGNAVSLGGWGDIDIKSEEMRFEFYTVWSQVLKRWLSTPLGDVTSFLSGNLFKIEMVRKNGEMQYKPVMLPAITEPVRGVAERLRNRFSR
jgi:hypothetical protein